MKIKKGIAFIAFSIIVFSSCKNSLNVQSPYKDITVVYGLIDQNDPVHYFRINKAFEGNGDAYTMAQQYDSIYYPVGTISAVLVDSSPTTDAIVNTIALDTTTTVPLSPGTFSYPKQLLYYTNVVLNPADYYNLIVTNTKTGKKSRGSTLLLPDVSFTQYDPASNSVFYLGTSYSPTTLQWNNSPNGRIYQLTIEFYYDNQIGSGPRVLQPPLQLIFAQEIANTLVGGNEQLEYSITQQQLFSIILAQVPYINGVTRRADSLGIVFTTGTDDLNTYIQLSQPPTGINQDVPSFTNVTNGVGLYTARHVQTYYKGVDNGTLDSLTTEPRFTNGPNGLGFIP